MAINLAEALAEDFQVLVAYGGVEHGFKTHVETLTLPQLVDGQDRHELVSLDGPIETVKKRRLAMLNFAARIFRPDFLIVEHFPYGRQNFKFEIEPLFAFLDCPKFASFRGTLGRSVDASRFDSDAKHFSKIFLHCDSSIEQPEVIGDTCLYTGYLARKINGTGKANGIILNMGTRPDAVAIAEKVHSFVEEPIFGSGGAFNPDIHEDIALADLVICTAGYNSAVESLTAKSAILIPLDEEQRIRARAFESAGLAACLMPEDICESAIKEAMNKAKSLKKCLVDADGARKTREFLKCWQA
jgi:predicted glycosyltransferase